MPDSKPPVDYRETVFLPKTDFAMKAGLPQREPELLKRWEAMGLYKRLREEAKGRPKYVLHDGPPYANGNLHIGHALNKILKDIVTRSRQMSGFDSNYVPGWDCHGLPIEWKIEEEYRARGKDKAAVPVNEFRAECRAFAEKWVGIQRGEFKRLGVVGDWDDPYLTMAYEAEAIIANELLKFAADGQLYRGSKPVMWSVVEHTALAEAEVEYADIEVDTIYVKFPVRGLDASVVIWTTTPWTIPGNRAISYSSRIDYGVYEVNKSPADNWTQVGEKLILADKLADEVLKAGRVEEYKRLGDAQIEGIVCDHPLAHPSRPTSWAPQGEGSKGNPQGEGSKGNPQGEGSKQNPPGEGSKQNPQGEGSKQNPQGEGGKQNPQGEGGKQNPQGEGSKQNPHAEVPPQAASKHGPQGYDFPVPLLDGDHVTDDAGTGFVHTAPSHGADDYNIWMEKNGGPIPTPVNAEGVYTKDAPGFEGAVVIDKYGKWGNANKLVIQALKDAGALLAHKRKTISYPHSWRSKKPIIFRNTPQWFISMEKKGLRDIALKAIEDTKFFPAAGQTRLRSMISERPDWVISRQRAWGVPIALFVNKVTGEILNDSNVNKRIYDSFCEHGADAWFADGAAGKFLGETYNSQEWEQVKDILDVWFDSGSTHAFCLERRPDLKWPADLYLEGSDQHRGWFHSSLLESCGTRGRAPYDAVLTHGFVVAEDGRKMSKSLGNIVTPQDVIKQSGADILRLWVASADYAEDLRLGPEILKTNIEAYRKLRNTMRYILGALDGLKDWEQVHPKDMPELERYILHRLHEVHGQVMQAYEVFDYKRLFAVLTNFMNQDLSAFYFDIRKDTLYCDPWSSDKRRSCRSVLDQLFHCLATWWAPVLAFTMEEVWLSRFPHEKSSVHVMPFARPPEEWRDEALAGKWAGIRRARGVVTGALEIERAEKRIGSALEAAPVVYVADAKLLADLKSIDFAECCITSALSLEAGEGPSQAFRLPEVSGVAVVPKLAEGKKCARSWKISTEIGSDPEYPDITPRDAAAVREWRQRFGK